MGHLQVLSAIWVVNLKSWSVWWIDSQSNFAVYKLTACCQHDYDYGLAQEINAFTNQFRSLSSEAMLGLQYLGLHRKPPKSGNRPSSTPIPFIYLHLPKKHGPPRGRFQPTIHQTHLRCFSHALGALVAEKANSTQSSILMAESSAFLFKKSFQYTKLLCLILKNKNKYIIYIYIYGTPWSYFRRKKIDSCWSSVLGFTV